MVYDTPWLTNKAHGIIQIYDTETKKWESLIDPATLKVSIQDLDSGEGTGRNQEGEMFRDRVAVKEKIKLTFPPMYRSDFHKMLKLISNQFFKVRYFSDMQLSEREVDMYVGDREATVYNAYDTNDNLHMLVKDISFNFIER